MELPISSQQASSSPSSRTRLGGLGSRLKTLLGGSPSWHAQISDGPPPMDEHPALRKSGPRRGFSIFRKRGDEARRNRANAVIPPPSGQSPSDTTGRPPTPPSPQTRVMENLRATFGDSIVSSHSARRSRHRRQHRDAWVRRPRRKYELRDFGSLWKNRHIRRRLVSCGIAGLVLSIVLAVYLAFAVAKSTVGQEFHVLLILLIMIFTIFFCHSILRLAMMLLRGPRDEYASNRVPSRVGPMGYAQPERPIHVVLARDEEIAADGVEAGREKVMPPPPAYGLWRSSVRINPNLLYWQRVEPMPKVNEENGHGESRPDTANRPPSYTSDNGVDYIVQAQPRSTAPDRPAGCPASGESRVI
ncbi:hypothetical protein VTN00DRAFT_7516 [Thermoascus crustaceus]|uniref:uncharacterized protein n=1 Tax=Thermoascus crustaceus TaxID=5088 RepID=UPI0037437A7A